ncbi:hypothetical protein KM043_004458 [Ampulex compressa]|nr:hypothetical protein KM043_004458 [Ampulex compressa]
MSLENEGDPVSIEPEPRLSIVRENYFGAQPVEEQRGVAAPDADAVRRRNWNKLHLRPSARSRRPMRTSLGRGLARSALRPPWNFRAVRGPGNSRGGN